MALPDVNDLTNKLKQILIQHGKVEEASREFKKFDDTSERVRFVEKLMKDYNINVDTTKLKLPKSNAISDSYRKRADALHLKKEYLQALEAYNQSLCFAEVDSQNISKAYAGRSSVYYGMEQYKEALLSIQMAKQQGCPEEIEAEIMNREKLSEEMISNKSDTSEEFNRSELLKMSYKAHADVPYIADCLELKSDAKFGRYITTKVALKPGDVVSIEEPFSKFLLPALRYKYCATCLSDNNLNLIACNGCTSTMFCSEKCAESGFEKFHKYECPIVDKLNSIATKIARIAVRTFFEAFDICDGDIEKLGALCEENYGKTRTVFDLNGKINPKQLLQAIDALATNEGGRNMADLFQRCGVVSIISQLFINHTSLEDKLPTDDDKDFFRCFLFKQTQIAACNYHGLYNGVLHNSELETNPQYGSGSFPFCSLINHSCAPNLVRLTFNTKNYVV